MTGDVQLPGSSDWVGCLVLVVAPQSHMASVVDGVRRAEERIFDDPVLADTARVATTRAAAPLEGQLDDIAYRLRQELLDWALSPRNPAPLTTFCVVIVDPDAQGATELAQRLATTRALSSLPTAYRVAAPGPDVASGALGSDIVRQLLEAVDATARRVERAPGCWLTREQLGMLSTGSVDGSLTSTPTSSGGLRSDLAQPAVSTPDVRARPDGPRRAPLPPPPRLRAESARSVAPAPSTGADHAISARATGDEVGRDRPAARVAERRRFRLTRRQPTNIELIEGLSGQSARVSMLYVVMVSEPVRPPRGDRTRRADVALRLTRELQSLDGAASTWHVRAFSAGRHVSPSSPLPSAAKLRRKHFPERWGEYFKLFDCVDDLLGTLEQDTSSFLRRNGTRPTAFVLFLANKPATLTADRDRQLARLCDAAHTIWVSFDRQTAQDLEQPSDERMHVVIDHEDVVDHLSRIVLSHVGGAPGPSITQSAHRE